ncbi:hypothetical protein ABK040_015267 [Willaertia magna]
MVNNSNNNNSPDYTPLYEQQQQQNSERDVIDNNNNPTAKKRNYGTYLDEHHHSYSQQQRHHSQHSQHYQQQQQPYDHHSHHSQQNPPPSIGGYSSDDERSSTNYSHHHHYPSLSSSSTSSTNPTSHLPTSSSVNASGSVSGSVSGNNYLNNSNIIMGFNKKKLRLSIHENTKNAIQQQLFHGSTSVLLTITKQQDNLHSSDQQQQVIIDKNNTSGNVGTIIPPSIQFLQSIMPYKDCVLKYIYLNNNNLLIEFIDLHSTLIFIYLYYDIGIIYNDNKYLLNLILNNNDNSLINIVYPNYNNNSINNKILYLIIKDLTFLDKLFNYYLLNLNFKLLELPNIDKSKRILIEFNNINDYNNIYEQLNNLNNIIIIKSKLNNLNLENYNYPTIEYKNNNNNSTILYVDGFTSKKVNCNVLFLLFGIYGDVIKIKISFLGNIPYALIQFTNIEGANRSFNFLNNNYSLFGEVFNISFTNLIDINETFPNLDIYSSTPPSTNTLLNIENTNYSNYHLLIGELFETYYDHPLHRFRLGSAIGSLKNLDHITEPNKMLCISNIQIDTTSEELESYFLGIANIKMEQVKFFGHKPKLRTKMATVTLPSINDAITALVLLNDIKVNDHHININFAEPIRNITIHPAYPTVQSNNNYTTTSTTYYGSATNNNFVPPPPYNNNSGGSGSGHFRGSSSRGRGSGGYRGRGGGYYRGGGRGNVMQ